MKVVRQVGALLLLLVSFAVPAMACAAPDAAMTAEELSCCRMMKHDCGQMEMPPAHHCCKKAPGTLRETTQRTPSVEASPVIAVVAWGLYVGPVPAVGAANGGVRRPEHSPPKPPTIVSSLRV